MANIPIKVLLDKDRSPFIPFSTTSSIVENGTNRRLDKILGNLDDLQTNNKNSLVSAINEVLVGSGSGAGINIQIVDELPTENISLTTIYFKHMTTGKLHNVYEEWMYINDAWELIGTTEMDLSGYATTAMVGDLSTLKTTDKDSVVDAVNELVDKQLVAGDGIELDGNVIKSVSDVPIYRIKASAHMSNNTFVSIDKQDILKIEDKINKAYKSGLNSIGFIVSSKNNNEQYLLINNSNDIQSKPSTYWLYSIESVHNRYSTIGQNEPYMLLTIQLTFGLSWTGDTCKVTSANICKAPLSLLATNNTAPYTPTTDYHPATKKYVDDKVAEGSGSGVDLSNYLAKDNTTEFTPTADYNPSTKKYVDDKFSSVPLIDSYTKTEVDTKLANYLAKDNLTEYTPTSDYHPATKKFVETVVASIDMSDYYNKTEIDTKFSDYYNKNSVDTKLANYLAKDNTTVFTPTENYQPSTKKYVDDTVSSATKRVNKLKGVAIQGTIPTAISSKIQAYEGNIYYNDYLIRMLLKFDVSGIYFKDLPNDSIVLSSIQPINVSTKNPDTGAIITQNILNAFNNTTYSSLLLGCANNGAPCIFKIDSNNNIYIKSRQDDATLGATIQSIEIDCVIPNPYIMVWEA